jgi:hypothetical protein
MTILCDTSFRHSSVANYLLVRGNQVPSAKYLQVLFRKAEVIVFPSSVSVKRKFKLLEACSEAEKERIRWLGEGALHVPAKNDTQ